jgi:hypothetical protein
VAAAFPTPRAAAADFDELLCSQMASLLGRIHPIGEGLLHDLEPAPRLTGRRRICTGDLRKIAVEPGLAKRRKKLKAPQFFVVHLGPITPEFVIARITMEETR